MKWIEIAKAKPKFDVPYLVTDGESVATTNLVSTTQTAKGLVHFFAADIPSESITHIALITLPNQKEVGNG